MRAGRALAVLVVALVAATGIAGTLRNSRGASDAATPAAGGRALPLESPVALHGLAKSALNAATFSVAASPARAAAPGETGGVATNQSAGALNPLPAGTIGQSARVEETGGLDLVVRGSQIEPDIGRLTALVAAYGGFVAGTQTQSASPGNPAQGTVELQVPEASFATVLSQAQELGKVVSLTTQATDVTGQYVDLQARITALQASRQQYLTIMTRATTVGSVLSVQSQLDDLQGQLEQLQGQLQLLNSETAYSTLAVTLSQSIVVPLPPKPKSGLAAAWNSAVSGFVGGFEDVIRVAGPLLFALLLLGALWMAGRSLWRFRRRRGAPS
jgi:Domain of unknown function (DUF4349)